MPSENRNQVGRLGGVVNEWEVKIGGGHFFPPLQRNCLYFALTTQPRHRWIPKYKIQKKILRKLFPIVNSIPVKFVIVLVLVFNTIVLSLQVRWGRATNQATQPAGEVGAGH